MKILLVFLLLLQTNFLRGQENFEGGTFSLRLATTVSAKNSIHPNYPTNSSVNHYSNNGLGFESTALYHYNMPKFRVAIGIKAGGYALDNRLNIQAEQSRLGYEYAPRPLVTQQIYLGAESSVELRIAKTRKTSFYLGPIGQIVYARQGFVGFEHVYLDQNSNLQQIYYTELSTNPTGRPYLFWGGKVSTAFQLSKRLGLGFSLGYLYSQRELVDSDVYIIYTLDNHLQGTISKPFQYLFIGVELSLLRKKSAQKHVFTAE